jgi:C-terminal peptidase prc
VRKCRAALELGFVTRSARWLALCLMLAACASATATTTSTTAARSTTTMPTVAESPAGSTSTTDGETARNPVDQVGCDEAVDALLCEGYSLIQRHYVDPVSDMVLATAAAGAITALESDRASGTLTCAIPNADFDPVCEAIAVEGATSEVSDEAALAGMISALDPNSAYLDPDALRLLEEEQSGEVQGIGALVASEDLTAPDPETTPCAIVSSTCRLVVISTFDESPAERAGLLPGDVFVAVDGVSIDGWNVDEVTATVRGEAGTEVELTVDRAGVFIDLVITRAALTIPVVESEVVESVGYLRLNLFTDTADRQVHEALASLLAEGIENLVLDLRDNPGGALDATVNIASEFLEQGVVVRTQSPDSERAYEVEAGGIAVSSALDIVVLVNRASASASEVLSAALQEAERAVVIGENTFGKNTVQQRFGLSNGGALKLTVARWVTASGADFGEGGVTPDVEIEFDPDLSVTALVGQVSALAGWTT